MTKFVCSFAYDVPHYVDFIVEAESEEAALIIAQDALDADRFAQVRGRPCYENEAEFRVFTDGPANGDDHDHIPMLDDLDDIAPASEKLTA